MYLVELRPGKEELYRNGDDLALAIRDGDVDARSRIYHRATAKWISITLHPQYKAIIAEAKDEPVERSLRTSWRAVLPASLTGQAVDAGTPSEAADDGDLLQHWKQPLWLGLTCVLLAAGIQLASSGPRPPWSERSKAAVVQATEERTAVARGGVDRLTADRDAEEGFAALESEGQELASLASETSWQPSSQPSLDPITTVVSKTAPTLPRAPRLRSKALRAALVSGNATAKAVKAHSVEAVLQDYEAASDQAFARLETRWRVARLNRLFAVSRLTPGGGVNQTRLGLAAVVNFVREFRQQQGAIDVAFEDSVTHLAKQHGWTPKEVRRWYSRPQRKETPTLELVSSTLITTIDSLLGVLDGQAGAYKVRGTAIAFEDPAVAKEYGLLRTRIKEQIDAVIAAGGATSSGPGGLLLQTIGTTTLPRET